MVDSLTAWDVGDDKADWTPKAIAAAADVYLDDYMLFDVAKSMTDDSFLEIEKSTLRGKPYQTGGGRTGRRERHRDNDDLDGQQR